MSKSCYCCFRGCQIMVQETDDGQKELQSSPETVVAGDELEMRQVVVHEEEVLDYVLLQDLFVSLAQHVV